MELYELVAAVKSAKTKSDLADLVSAELSLDLDKNKTMKSLRAEVLSGLGVTEDDSVDENEPVVLIDPNAEGSDQAVTATAEVIDSGAVIVHKPLVVPAAEDEPEPEAKADTDNRLLRNTDTGTLFVWTPALAEMNNMVEV